ncbi:MAG: hypothetical protein M1814_006543 [Vezdaea aestivalis]|nr:MAG: hypothetical protein M1814_006543 [Vezdaea aestivalis]
MAPQHLGDSDSAWDQQNVKGVPESRQGPEVYGPPRARKKFVLCFDGTGNKFQGNDGDSNILKIFRMLDRQTDKQFHYYQPGIGTYVTSNSYSHTSLYSRMNSWYQKAKDSAVGTSFDSHVMGGYKFLMRYYSPGDDIFFFGFSRGAYIARFLAEMLDYVGLLSAGNEELARFAWKTFSEWQQRTGGDEEMETKRKELYRFMKAFRETFSRPVRRIRFLGLFDTVNSVPRFESAWMERSKFPYTARSSAKVIRHAVGIDERRAKFRQDLLSGDIPKPTGHQHHHRATEAARKFSVWIKPVHGEPEALTNEKSQAANGPGRYKGASRNAKEVRTGRSRDQKSLGNLSARYRPTSRASRSRNRSSVESHRDFRSANGSQLSLDVIQKRVHEDFEDSDSEDGELEQDIKEVWFPGCHADIGGGWNLAAGEEFPLSHAPLVWMVREAQKAGLDLDEEKMRDLNCLDDRAAFLNSFGFDKEAADSAPPIPQLQISGSPVPESPQPVPESQEPLQPSQFERALDLAATKGVIHDCLAFNNGLPHTSVLSWKIMEYLPFRRMDLQPDGSWSPIRWPLPRGEPRDVPSDAVLHNSVIKRMKANANYRPGNIIVGGGGRGIVVAPA